MKKNLLPGLLSVLLLAFFILAPAKETGPPLIIKGAKIYTCGPQGVLATAALSLEGGKIKKIFKEGEVPSGPSLDFSGLSIMPGIVDGQTYISGYYRLLENTQAVTSALIAYPAFDPLSHEVQEALKSGITTVHFAPRNANLVGGISSIFKLTDKLGDLRFLKKEAFLKISLNGEAIRQDRAPTSLMGAEMMLDELIQRAKDNDGLGREAIFKEVGIDKLATGRLLPLIAASSYEEIQTALKWLSSKKMRGILVGGEEAYLFADELKKNDIAILFSPLLPALPEKMAGRAALLLKKGVKTAIASFMPETDPWILRFSALLLYQQGISEEEALKTITILPAQILGIADAIGSIEEGKDADFVVFSGDPLDMRAKIRAVYINGQPALSSKEK